MRLFCTCRVYHVPVIALRPGGTKAKKALFKLLELKGVTFEMMNESSFHISAVWHERFSTTTKQGCRGHSGWVGHRDHELPAKKRKTVSTWRISRLHAHHRPSMNEFCVWTMYLYSSFPHSNKCQRKATYERKCLDWLISAVSVHHDGIWGQRREAYRILAKNR